MRWVAIIAFAFVAACSGTSQQEIFSSLGSGGGGDGGGAASTPFTCGSQTCNSAQYCLVLSGSGKGGTACAAIPSVCSNDRTCNCVDKQIACNGSFQCSETEGRITFNCQNR